MSLRTFPVVLLALCAGATSQAASTPAASTRKDVSAPASSLQKDVESAIERKDWPAAQRGAQALTEAEPGNAKAWRYLGLAYVNQGHPEQGIAPFQRSVELSDSAKTRGNLGTSYAMTGHTDQALPHFERAVELDPSYGQGWLYLGKARLQLGQREEALAALKKAEQLLPQNAEVKELLASAQPARSEPPKAAMAHYTRGAILAEQGKAADAEHEFREALALAPDFADCHYNLGRVLRARGDVEAAEREYRAAIQGYAPGDAALRADAENNLADLMTERGQGSEEAVKLVRDAISIRGERASYLDTLARACDAAGDPKCAAEAFHKLLASGTPLPQEVRAHAEQRLKALNGR